VEEPDAPVLIRDEDLDADHDDDAPLSLRSIDIILRPAQPQGLGWRVLAQELHSVCSAKPDSFDEAEQDPCWR
jgi:hypothetical protein